MGEFRMPSMGADMEAATLVEWKVQPGDRVCRGDIIAEIETEKGDIDVEVFENGVVEDILVEPGAKLPVGALMARIRSEGEAGDGAVGAEETSPASPPAAAPEEPERAAPASLPEEHAPEERPPMARGERRVRASPLARRVAADLGVDLNQVKGSGPDGAIQRADVERTAAQRPDTAAPAGAPAEEEPVAAPAEAAPEGYPTRMRQAIAKAMAQANREIPHYYLETHINMQRALQWLEANNAQRSINERLLPVVVLIKAVARALDDVPALNAYWRHDRHEPQEAIHIGFAISLRQGGLVTPAIHDADRKSLDEIMAALDDLITRARSGRLRSSELTDPTITVTSLGDLGVETVHGVIYPPQVALVGFGTIHEQPWAEDGMLGVRPVVNATLAADHRATDGRQGGKFLDAVNRYLQTPDDL